MCAIRDMSRSSEAIRKLHLGAALYPIGLSSPQHLPRRPAKGGAATNPVNPATVSVIPDGRMEVVWRIGLQWLPQVTCLSLFLFLAQVMAASTVAGGMDSTSSGDIVVLPFSGSPLFQIFQRGAGEYYAHILRANGLPVTSPEVASMRLAKSGVARSSYASLSTEEIQQIGRETSAKIIIFVAIEDSSGFSSKVKIAASIYDASGGTRLSILDSEKVAFSYNQLEDSEFVSAATKRAAEAMVVHVAGLVRTLGWQLLGDSGK